MGGLGNYLKQAALSHAFGIAAMTQPTGWTAALMTTEPVDAGTGGVEVTGTGYARASIGSWVWDGALDGVKNAVDVLFPLAGASDWTVANAVVVYDQLGNMLAHAALASPVTCLIGEQVRLPAGTLQLAFNP